MNRKLRVEELNRPDIDAFKAMKKLPVVMVLDSIRSFHNVGSVFRTADAFRFKEIVLCGITPLPPHREINKTALGATDSMTWSHKEDVVETVVNMKRQGYMVFALEQTANSRMLQNFNEITIDKPVALVLGNEVFGVNQKVIEVCDDTIEIPQEGTKHSLNVSVSAGMIMWEIFKKLRY